VATRDRNQPDRGDSLEELADDRRLADPRLPGDEDELPLAPLRAARRVFQPETE